MFSCSKDELLALQRQALLKSAKPGQYRPLSTVDTVTTEDSYKGYQLLSQGRVGCIVVAGGQGSRLGHEGPKGTFPISAVRHKSLFQLLAEKTVAASCQAGCALPLAIMTSQDNHAETVTYFTEHKNFGLEKTQLFFFTQENLPYLDSAGKVIYDAQGQQLESPAGNGTSLKHFYDKGIWHSWRKIGVEYVNFIQIDNPLADPFDAALIGYHAAKNGEVTLKTILREDPSEKVGVVVESEGQVAVVEYSELSLEEALERSPDGRLKYLCANLSIFCFEMEWIHSCHCSSVWQKMPLHAVCKPLSKSTADRAWKFEFYIFDLLKWAYGTHVIACSRESCFAPLKQKEGASGIEAVQQALLAADRRAFTAISGVLLPSDSFFELSAQFHYPTPQLLDSWKGCLLPLQPYIEFPDNTK